MGFRGAKKAHIGWPISPLSLTIKANLCLWAKVCVQSGRHRYPINDSERDAELNCLRICSELRIGLFGSAIRIESVVYTGKEAKTSDGCPVAKAIVRRSGDQEIVLALVRHRKGHNCDSAFIIVAIVVWDAIDRFFADILYDTIVTKVNDYGVTTQRRCARNDS